MVLKNAEENRAMYKPKKTREGPEGPNLVLVYNYTTVMALGDFKTCKDTKLMLKLRKFGANISNANWHVSGPNMFVLISSNQVMIMCFRYDYDI